MRPAYIRPGHVVHRWAAWVPLAGIGCLCVGTLGVAVVLASVQFEAPEDLLKAEKLTDVWTFFSAEKETKLEQTWSMTSEGEDEEPILQCGGKPYGYLKTKKAYENFELSLQWKYPKDENGNSGVFLFTDETDKIWPRSIQVQLHTPEAGSILPNNAAKIGAQSPYEGVELPVATWHKCVIRSQNGTVMVFINDKKVSEVSGCEPKKGAIALQSEGSEILFRRIRITPIVMPEVKESPTPANDETPATDHRPAQARRP